LARKKQVIEVAKPNDSWTITTELHINNRMVTPGTELKISGESGRFRFIKHVNTGSTEWIDVWGGKKGAENIRSFTPSRIKTVHSKNQTYQNLAKEYKAKKKMLKDS
jgi:hypothetical protein